MDTSKVGEKLPEVTYTWEESDAILYALGVGAGNVPEELPFCYENGLATLPTFGVLPSLAAVFGMTEVVEVNLMMLLHGEQAIRIHRPLPPSGTATTQSHIAAIWDKGKGAVIVVECRTADGDGPLVDNTFTAFIRGAGGFGGERGPSSDPLPVPDREPDAVFEQPTHPNSALLYRLSGDRNPLHADPGFAKMAGFDRPILHGLCTWGQVGRAVLGRWAGFDPARLASFQARFKGVVFPGETLVTRSWQDGDTVRFETTTRERGEPVLQSGTAEVR